MYTVSAVLNGGWQAVWQSGENFYLMEDPDAVGGARMSPVIAGYAVLWLMQEYGEEIGKIEVAPTD
jgi:hypothetical protein